MSRLRQITVAAIGSYSVMVGLTGCMADRPQSVSPSAVIETSGNQSLNCTASSTGYLTVWDQNTDKIVYGTKIHSGQSVSVDTDKNMVMLDSQVVSQNSLHRGDQYRIYFDLTSTAGE